MTAVGTQADHLVLEAVRFPDYPSFPYTKNVGTGTVDAESALTIGGMSEEDFDKWVVPADMTHPSAAE